MYISEIERLRENSHRVQVCNLADRPQLLNYVEEYFLNDMSEMYLFAQFQNKVRLMSLCIGAHIMLLYRTL